MFAKLKNAIVAAEWILSNLEWCESNLKSEIDEINSLREFGEASDWDYDTYELDTTKLDALNIVKKSLAKFVKDSQ